MIFERLKFKNFRLRSKLIIAYVILTVIPVSIIGYIAYGQYTRSIEEQVGEYIPLLLEQASEDIDNQIAHLKALPDALYNSNQVIEVLRKDAHQNKSSLLNDRFLVNSYLARTFINGGNSEVLGIFVLSKNRLFESTRIPYADFNFSEKPLPYGQDINMRGKTEILLPGETSLVFERNPKYVLIMRQLIDVENRTKLGTVFIAVDTTFMKDVLEKLEKKNESDIWFMQGDGRIIYHTNPQLIGTIDPSAKQYPKINGSFRSNEEQDNRIISTYTSESLQWTLINSVKVKDLTANTNKVRDATILLFVLFVIVSTLLSVVLAWNVSNPIYRLTRLMKQVEKGDFDVDLRVSSQDEIGTLASGFNSMTAKIKQLIQEKYQSELKQKEAQLYALQSQINPHFIYNTLETINMAAETGQNTTVVKMVTLLGRMLRYSISNKVTIVPLKLEVEHMKDYLTMQQIRFEDRLHFQIEEDVDLNKYITPKFILQPIVENAVKYGMEQVEETSIYVRVFQDYRNKNIVFTIEDNGPGIGEDVLARLQRDLGADTAVQRDSSFGLVNVHARIMMAFGEKYGMSITSQLHHGTSVTIIIPVLEIEQLSRQVKGDLHVS
ncbi:MAG: sensor histidine kinase [Bacillota bacterium]